MVSYSLMLVTPVGSHCRPDGAVALMPMTTTSSSSTFVFDLSPLWDGSVLPGDMALFWLEDSILFFTMGKMWASRYSVRASSMASFARLWCSTETLPTLLLCQRKLRLDGHLRQTSRVQRILTSMPRMSAAEKMPDRLSIESMSISSYFDAIKSNVMPTSFKFLGVSSTFNFIKSGPLKAGNYGTPSY